MARNHRLAKTPSPTFGSELYGLVSPTPPADTEKSAGIVLIQEIFGVNKVHARPEQTVSPRKAMSLAPTTPCFLADQTGGGAPDHRPLFERRRFLMTAGDRIFKGFDFATRR